MSDSDLTKEGKRFSAAVIMPKLDYGLGAAYLSIFEGAGWKTRVIESREEYGGGDTIVIISFDQAAKRSGLIRRLPTAALTIDLVYRKEYETGYLNYPFHLLDNTTVIIHDFETRTLIKKIIRPINCRIVMFPYPSEQGGKIVGDGVKTIYIPAEFESHPWVKGLNAMPVENPYPSEVPAGSFIAIPEYDPLVWPLVNWGAATGLPVVAPGAPTFLRTIFYGALLFDPDSEADFRLKVSILNRPKFQKPSGDKFRFGVVTPRYEKQTAGGAENHAAQLAQSLAQSGHQAEIITTCTDSMLDWNNNLPEGVVEDGAITVRRFSLEAVDSTEHHRVGHMINAKQELTWTEETEWMRQSIRSEAMDEYIKSHSDEYDYLLFIPYLYGTTYWGSQQAPEKSFLVPCYHREPIAFTRIIKQNAQWFSGVLFNTVAEKKLAETELKIHNSTMFVVGEGVDTEAKGDAARFNGKHGVDGDFMLYVGRFQREKNVGELLDFFKKYARSSGSGAGLLMAGKGDVEIQKDSRAKIRSLGFLPEQDKTDAFAACSALILPSTQESFSIVMMEAWAQGRPVIANARCDAAREHIFTCQGGLLYHDAGQFEQCVKMILENREMAEEMGKRGREYVLNNFKWDKIVSRLVKLLEQEEIASLHERLGEAMSVAARRLDENGANALGRWIADVEAQAVDAAPFAEATLPELIDRVEDFSDIHTKYKEFSHRAMIGGVWSRFRGAVTRHLRKNYIEPFEGKQQAYNKETANLLRKIYEDLRGKP